MWFVSVTLFCGFNVVKCFFFILSFVREITTCRLKFDAQSIIHRFLIKNTAKFSPTSQKFNANHKM